MPANPLVVAANLDRPGAVHVSALSSASGAARGGHLAGGPRAAAGELAGDGGLPGDHVHSVPRSVVLSSPARDYSALWITHGCTYCLGRSGPGHRQATGTRGTGLVRARQGGPRRPGPCSGTRRGQAVRLDPRARSGPQVDRRLVGQAASSRSRVSDLIPRRPSRKSLRCCGVMPASRAA